MVHEPSDYAAPIIDAIIHNRILWLVIYSTIYMVVIGCYTHWTAFSITVITDKLNRCKMSVFSMAAFVVLSFIIVLHEIGEIGDPNKQSDDWIDKPFAYVSLVLSASRQVDLP